MHRSGVRLHVTCAGSYSFFIFILSNCQPWLSCTNTVIDANVNWCVCVCVYVCYYRLFAGVLLSTECWSALSMDVSWLTLLINDNYITLICVTECIAFGGCLWRYCASQARINCILLQFSNPYVINQFSPDVVWKPLGCTFWPQMAIKHAYQCLFKLF